ESVFEQTWHEFGLPRDAGLLRERWNRLLSLRSDVLKQLEELRAAGKVGSSLAGEGEVYANGEGREVLKSFREAPRVGVIHVQARVVDGAQAGAVATALSDVKIRVNPSPHRKCERCWHYRSDVGATGEHPDLCGRCVANLYGSGETRVHA